MKTPKNLVILLVGILLATAGFAAGYFGQKILRLASLSDKVMPTVNSNTNLPSVSEEPVEGIAVGEPNPNGLPEIPMYDEKEITWQEPAEYPAFDIWYTGGEYNPLGEILKNNDYIKSSTKFFKVGTFTKDSTANFSGADLILAEVTCEGPCFYPTYVYFVKSSDNLVMLKYMSDPSLLYPESNSKYDVDLTYQIYSITDYPEHIYSEEKKIYFELQKEVRDFFADYKMVKTFVDPNLGQAYLDDYTSDSISPEGGTLPKRNGLYFRAPDGTIRVYKMVVPLVVNEVPNVIWNDKKVNVDTYISASFGGCGARDLAAVMSKDQVNPDTDLVVSGKATTGDIIYTLKDPAHPMLTDIYENQYWVYGEEEKLSFADFLKLKPVFFWKDPFGRLIRFQNNKFVPAAECGKPVIYLYPEKTTAVNVQLDPKGGFTYTEPQYPAGGWNVIADQNSNLIDSVSKSIYPYLFWEGRGGLYSEPTKGFVIKNSEVHSFLNEKLAKLGLNEKEIADFEEFWEPRMQAAPYYFVSFYGNQVMDQLAPLTITPTPDTIIRVLMDYKELQAPIEVQGYEIRTPERNGFTVVEWGGVIR